MRSCAAALIALAIVTGCFGASGRSRQRSPVRSAPIAADIKQDVNFDCPEEFGYYPHPTDCTLYYVCVFGGALLESCTGGLMYSNELQTCDWPRNVGCDGASAVRGEELERISEREPPPPPPRRTPPPPPPRAQPNPIVTSRGQPKFSRDEYEKQQQLYAEVDDLPPVEEIESDRQQRVYRGQPSTIGQVQKDRDGYSSQVSSGRNFNSNIIPASIPQNSGKIGSFSFGSQVDDRRTAAVTPAPQSYSEDKKLTDSHHDKLLDIETNEINDDVTKQSVLTRGKREVEQIDTTKSETVSSNNTDTISERSRKDNLFEFYDIEPFKNGEDDDQHTVDDTERGKRQIRYYAKNGYKNPGKNWSELKPVKFVDSLPQSSYNPQSNRYQQSYNNQYNNNYYDSNRRPYSLDSNSHSLANPFLAYQNDNLQNSFKPSLPDTYNNQKPAQNPLNIATQIITKSPPISSLSNQNSFASPTGGFYNNAPQTYQSNNYYSQNAPVNQPHNQRQQVSFPDSSLLPSTVVTGKPILMSTSPRNSNSYNKQEQQSSNEDEDESEEDYDSSEEEHDEHHSYPKPPYEFTHPSNKYANIENPFANPNFDFDEYLSKLSNGQYTTHNPKKTQVAALKATNRPIESSSPQSVRSSTLNYKGISTPRPFSVIPNGAVSTLTPPDILQSNSQQYLHRPQASVQTHFQQQQQSINVNDYTQQQQQHPNIYNQQQHLNIYNQQQHQNQNLNVYNQRQQQNSNQNNGLSQYNAGTLLEAVRPNLKPPNFVDDRQLPISYSFSKPIEITTKPNNYQNFKIENSQPLYSTAKPYLYLTATGTPILLSSPKTHYVVKNEKLISQQPYQVSTGKPNPISSLNSQNGYITFKQSTPKPLTTLANEQLSALHHYWKSTTESTSSQSVTLRPINTPDVEKLKKLFAQAVQTSMQTPTNNQNYNVVRFTTTTTRSPKRRPIPKPSPEMNDYYYDDDDYYEPPVKSQYMPSTEIKPKRPLMAQNYKHYDDSYEDFEDEDEVVNISPRKPTKVAHKPVPVTKNHNDVSIVTKSPLKDYNKNTNLKIPVPVLVNFVTPSPTVVIHPQIGNFELVQDSAQNRTVHMRRPHYENGPNTIRPPKYLNQTTLRPYTVRHRLAKPTPVQDHATQKDTKVTRERARHPNIVAQMLTTPHDSHNQETRITKAKYDGITNSLEPTESVAPLSYSPSPRPKMLYNGSQNYSPDQFDPFYAIYDEDGELYKDTDYVQQYNVASVRPAVQQTYRGTPPPARRPVESYSPRPVPVSSNDYDDDLIQGQINNHNQNQYQSPVRQTTRGEGNELGYEHIPSSVKTTIYEATPISTIPTTTSTSTTTQRPTTAPFTEAMTPSRYTPRSSTDESPIPNSKSLIIHNSSKESSISSFPSTPSSVINFSSLAKPFEKTDNLHSLEETIPTTQTIHNPRRYHVTNTNNEKSVEVVSSNSNTDKKRIVSLTTGFSIRRNSNNTDNPYSLTLLSRPYDDFDKTQKTRENNSNAKDNSNRYIYENVDNSNNKPEISEVFKNNQFEKTTETNMRRKDSRYEVSDDYDIPIYIKPRSRSRTKPAEVQSTTLPSTSTTKYYLKSVLKRPASFFTNESNDVSTENSVANVQTLLDTGLQNTHSRIEGTSTTNRIVEITPKREQSFRSQFKWNEPTVSPYRTLDNLRNLNKQEKLGQDFTTSTTATKLTTTSANNNIYFKSRDRPPHLKPSYYSYRIEDEVVPDQTTEVFSSSVKNVIKAFFNNIVSTPVPQGFSSTYKPATILAPKQEQKVVNIGFHKKPVVYTDDDNPTRHNTQRLKIITEPTTTSFETSSTEPELFIHEKEVDGRDLLSTTTMAPVKNILRVLPSPTTTPTVRILTNPEGNFLDLDHQSKFSNFMSTTSKAVPEATAQVVEPSSKFQNIIREHTSEYSNDKIDNDKTPIITKIESSKTSEIEWKKPTSEITSDIASTTSTTKSTTTLTVNTDPTTKSTTKSVSYPTRASRVNPAIKLAASNPASGRRSYQSSSKCSSDNSLQANPKCNEIKYQRPTTSTRGRGSAHYSKSGPESAQPAPNRGTPPTRSRPTLKPSTAIVSENIKFSDIYEHPPSRPAPVYPQPTPDKTAAKCRKDVCLLPDCYCGGKDIPGEMPLEQVPQIVLLTFDDSVNDLNKGLYADLFEKGRVNPNGCPISATFYVSHEWTDYSQVQNLYSAGHEMASHTISHSFGEQFSQKKWNREVGGQREILAAYGGVKLEDVRGMRAPFLSIGGNKMFKMLYDSNFTYDSSMPVYENRPPSWPYTLDYKLFHDCMIPPCPTKSYPGVWEVPMVMWQDLNGGRCSMGDACANPPEAENVYKMLLKNFDRHYTTNRAPFGLFYHAAWFTQAHHKEGFIMFLDFINQMQDVWIVTNWQALQWVRDPTPLSRLNNFQPFQCNYQDRPKKCNNPKVCNLWHKSGVRYMRTCQPCPEIYPWTGKSGIRSSRIDNDNGE